MNRTAMSVAAAVVMAAAAAASDAAITVHSDYDFANNIVPGVFSNAYGTGPTTGGGVLSFDGTTALSASTVTIYGGAAPANNFGYEVILTPSQLDAFDIFIGIVDGTLANQGSFLFQQASLYRLIESGEGSAASTTAPAVGTTVALAFVMDNGTARLFVNGAQQATRVFSAGGTTPIDTATLEAVTLGGNLFDNGANPGGGAAMGAFNGTIDRARWFTFAAGEFAASDLLGPNAGTIPVVPAPAAMPAGLALLALTAMRRRGR